MLEDTGKIADIAAPLLEVQNMKKHFPIHGGLLRRQVGAVKAVDGVSFEVFEGETLGLVGESGCGKSTIGAMLMGLITPSAGTLSLKGRDITGVSHQAELQLCRDLQIVFQDPYASLDRRMSVFDIVAEPLQIHGLSQGGALKKRVLELLSYVGLNAEQAERLPTQFSGGQRQRIGIARALALEPKILVLDEPVSALDVSIQAQVLNLLRQLQRELNLAYVFISHDLSVVNYMADRIAVMQLGKIVETGARDVLFRNPSHPYTRALLSAVPSDNPFRRTLGKRVLLEGEPANPADPPPGCSFHRRCIHVRAECKIDIPELIKRSGCDHPVACHFPQNEVMKGTND